jgi:tetratricopeptide (TPR) repeat protein
LSSFIFCSSNNALGVVNVLEGTVRRDGNHVRVSTELVDARNDNTIWADSYDRDLTDIFVIQSEIAQTVASKLSARLSPEEKRGVEEKPTENLEAYDLYLQANELLRAAEFFNAQREDFIRPLTLLEEATRKDPRFALAYCSIAQAHNDLFLFGFGSAAERALADAAVSEALRLRPDLPEAHLAAALHLVSFLPRDLERARGEIAIAARGLPNSPYVLWCRGVINAGQGRWEDAVRDLEKAAILDPRYPKLLTDLGQNTYLALRRFRQAEQTLDRVIDLKPDDPTPKIIKAYINFGKDADLKKYLAIFGTVPASREEGQDVASFRFQAALFARDWTKAREILRDGVNEEFAAPYSYAYLPRGCWEIWLSRLQGDSPGIESRFPAARDQLNRKLEQDPNDPALLSALGIVDAAMGRKQDAIQEATRAVEMIPIYKDAQIGPSLVTNLAIVYSWLNETELAFRELTISVNTPGGVLYGELAIDPMWDPLRKDPRFDKLLAELAPRD